MKRFNEKMVIEKL